MKLSNSKKQLAKIIRDNGGWPDGAEWSAQDGKGYGHAVGFFKESLPKYGNGCWCGGVFLGHHAIRKVEGIGSPHQTILSRDEYFHLYPAPDADGWIEWNGGECPVERGAPIDVKFRDGTMQLACDALGEKSPSHRYLTSAWSHSNHHADIIAYRPHKPEQSKPEFCESVMRSIPDPEAKPTIEQLAADYRNLLDFARRKQQEADDAKADADARLKALELAGEALGLLVSPITAKQEPEPVIITDWRDLQVGDAIRIESVFGPGENEGYEHLIGEDAIVVEVGDPGTQELRVEFGGKTKLIDGFTFIRRP